VACKVQLLAYPFKLKDSMVVVETMVGGVVPEIVAEVAERKPLPWVIPKTEALPERVALEAMR